MITNSTYCIILHIYFELIMLPLPLIPHTVTITHIIPYIYNFVIIKIETILAPTSNIFLYNILFLFTLNWKLIQCAWVISICVYLQYLVALLLSVYGQAVWHLQLVMLVQPPALNACFKSLVGVDAVVVVTWCDLHSR